MLDASHLPTVSPFSRLNRLTTTLYTTVWYTLPRIIDRMIFQLLLRACWFLRRAVVSIFVSLLWSSLLQLYRRIGKPCLRYGEIRPHFRPLRLSAHQNQQLSAVDGMRLQCLGHFHWRHSTASQVNVCILLYCMCILKRSSPGRWWSLEFNSFWQVL